MKPSKIINLSVHDLVDFLLRKGDIDNRIYNQDTRKKGSEMHSFHQKNNSRNHLSEVSVQTSVFYDDFTVNVNGRIDCIYLEDVPIIEEIKTTIDDLDNYIQINKDWHLGQAICYAYIYLKNTGEKKCQIQLFYLHQSKKNDAEKIILNSYSFNELEKVFLGYIEDYISFYKNIYEHYVYRNQECEKCIFPFDSYRDGQKDFMSLVDECVSTSSVGLIEGPTGIGKTIAALYPTIKRFSDNIFDKIFYFTAKNTGRNALLACVKILCYEKPFLKVSCLAAKEKLCLSTCMHCNPDECQFAKNYYTNLKSNLFDALSHFDYFDLDTIIFFAKSRNICPFEFALDLSVFCDIVAADYNYFFDPFVKLERYFLEPNNRYVALVDEAHNLSNRAKDIYSERIDFQEVKVPLYLIGKRSRSLKKRTILIIEKFQSLDKSNDFGQTKVDYIDEDILNLFEKLLDKIDELRKKTKESFSSEEDDFLRKINRFLKLYEKRENSDVLFYEKTQESFSVNLRCLDASNRIYDSLSTIGGKVLFSGTLSPIDYYLSILGLKNRAKTLSLPSPFSKDNLKLIIAKANLRYKERDNSLEQVVSYLKTFVDAKKGNYFIFTPSFAYLEKLMPYFIADKNYEVYVQKSEMTEFDRENFISHFKAQKDRTILGICVMGGAFSEGIDLVSDALIGVAVISVGLPSVCFENTLIKNYYDEISQEKLGFDFAYKIPGMNKVTQAVGRLIRSENDRGAALLIDDRYFTSPYKILFRPEWSNYEKAYKPSDIEKILNDFYKNDL